MLLESKHQFDKETLTYLWENHLIAVQYCNIASTKTEDYSGEGRNALNKLWRYCKEGVLIGAFYRNFDSHKMMLGEIEKGSEIRIIEKNGYQNKTILLSKIKVICLSEFPLLSAIKPRQKATNFWPSANKILNALYTGVKLPHEVSSLAPGQLEVICYEYLRIQNILGHLLLPIGRTMPEIDICGINQKSERVYAQVTHSKNREVINKKIEILKEFDLNAPSKKFFFGPQEYFTTDAIVSYQPIEEVFAFMLEKFPVFVDALLGF